MTPKDDPGRPSHDLTLLIKEESWTALLDDPEGLASQVLELVLAELKLGLLNLEMSLVLADDDFVRHYNNQFRHKDSPTNVLSFPALDHPEDLKDGDNLGDVMMAFQTVLNESKEQAKTFKDHFIHLQIHGILHLLGYDHVDEEEAKHMESLEIKLLKRLGVDNPYQELKG